MSTVHWLEEYLTDFVSLAISAVLLACYHIYLRLKLRRNPLYTFQSVTHTARQAWVHGIMEDEAKGILGVQTLRNSTMAATFFASTAVLLVMGTLTLSGQSEKLTTSWHHLNVLGSLHPGVWIAKVLFLLSDFLVAFFSFAMAVRLFHHVGFLLAVPAERRPAAITPHTVALHLNRAGRYYSVGMRAYYFAVPLVFWLFGPHFMISATVVLIAVLYHVDRAPRDR
ncbi:MAG: DUF599 domain-containing protein [Gammaproteobacteria bacterium]